MELGYIKTVLGCLGVFQFLFLFWEILIVKSFAILGVCKCYLKGQGDSLLSKRKRRFLLQKDHWPKPSPGQAIPAAPLFLPSIVSVSPSFLLCVFSLRGRTRNKTEEKYTSKKMLPCNLRSTKATSCCWRSWKQPMFFGLHPNHIPPPKHIALGCVSFPSMGSSLYQPLHLPCAVSWPRLQC